MEQKLHTPEGVRDIYSTECRKKLAVQEKLHELLHLYGYQDIQTTLDPGMHWRVVEGRIEDGTGQAGAAGSGV